MDYSPPPPHHRQFLAYSVRSACDISGIGRTTLYRLIAEGKIDARSCGGRTIVIAASLEAYVAGLPPAPIGKA